jgi:hypothetical protein
VSLKGALSKLTPPGEFESMNPKSIWMIWPSSSSRRFALCLSFTCHNQPAHQIKMSWSTFSIMKIKSITQIDRCIELNFQESLTGKVTP